MSFQVPSDDESSPSLPSTPDRNSRNATHPFSVSNAPSTTPAEPPPSSTASFTPAGAPTSSYMGSSLMRGLSNSISQEPVSSLDFGNKPPSNSSPKNPFSRVSKSPLGRSMRSKNAPRPSRLREEYVDDSGSDDGEEESPDRAKALRSNQRRAFMEGWSDSDEDEDEDEDEDADMFLDMARQEGDENQEDLMMLTTPAADERIMREAEDIFRATARRSGSRRQSFKCAAVAKDIYGQANYATIAEPPELILDTENLVNRLYTDGVGPEEDEERLDETLATVTGQLTGVWRQYIESLPQLQEEHAAEIGPGPKASDFEKAVYLATLALQVHHTRTGEDGKRTEPLPETLFRWLAEYHNPYPAQVQEVLRFRQGPANHTMFWPTVFITLLRGQVSEAQSLLLAAGWESARVDRRGGPAYTGEALANVQRAVKETCDMLENCPAKHGNWDVWNSDWTLFRVKARGALEQLRRFAEGKKSSDFAGSVASRQSLTATARKAESKIPWEIYENLNVLFEIVLGSADVILDTAQDWVEATVGLFGWWDETMKDKSVQFSRSRSLMLATHANSSEGYLDRLARSFHTAIESDFYFNNLNAVEVGMACVFEDNAKAVIGLLRMWSLPVASAVAETASLGHWLPQHQPSALYGFEELNAEDLEILGVNLSDPDETDGVKDNTLIQYAQELANYREIATFKDKSGIARDGWEVAIHVLGRMDSQQRSEETVGELVENLLGEIGVESSGEVDKVWRLLNDLGMIAFAEQVAEHFGDALKEASLRYGEAMWYYSLAHRPGKVREVMNLLISYSLIQSAAYPPAADLDGHLRQLLGERGATLGRLAKQDLEAADLLGRMLSGYATLRKFYELRDDESLPLARRRRSAAAALTMVVASSDDNIRGGLYDASRDAVVSEDFLLALLGEALVFVNSQAQGGGAPAAPASMAALGPVGDAPVISLDQLDVLLKAIEDVETVGSRVFSACDEFFQLVLASAPALLRGSTPADLMRSTSSLSAGGSIVMTGSSMLASQLKSSLSGAALAKRDVKRAWDWRVGLRASATARDVLCILRLGLTRDMARLWVAEADGCF